MAKPKLTVTTDVGTFTRTTARTYTHIVVARNERHELLEMERHRRITYNRELATKYAIDPALATNPARDGWITNLRDEADAAEAQGAITTDKVTDWFCHAWSGRLDLARSVANGYQLNRFRDVRIYSLAGERERT